MPRTESVYTQNKAFIDKQLKAGKTWRKIGEALKGIGVDTRFQSVHKAYLNYNRKQANNQRDEIPPSTDAPTLERYVKIHHAHVWKLWTKHDKARQKQVDKTSFDERLRNHTSASVQSGEIDSADSEIVQERCEMLAKYSQALASIYLYNCMILPRERWLADFENQLKVVQEITERMQNLID